MNKGILVIYNTCTVGRVAYGGWNNDIDSILAQDFEHYNVAVSECRGPRGDLDRDNNVNSFIEKVTSNGFMYNTIREKLPVWVTFNHTLREVVKRKGPYEYYMYMTSGIVFPSTNFFSEMYGWLNNNKDVGRATLAIEGTDNFFPPPEGHPYNKPGTDNGAFPPESLNSEPLQIMPGYAAAEHCWVYPHEMYEMYDGKLGPDMYLSNGSGALHSYLTSAIGKKNVIIPWNVVPRLIHKRTQDGPTKLPYPDSWWHSHRTRKEVDEFVSRLDENAVFVDTYCSERNPKWQGRSQQYLSPEHKEILLEKFGEDGVKLSGEDRVKFRNFMKKEFFVSKDIIDYENINSSMTEK